MKFKFFKLKSNPKTVTIKYDRKLWIDAKSLNKNTITQLEDLFTHRNPNYYIEKKFDAYADQFIITYTNDGNTLGFPRGGLSKIETVLKKNKYIINLDKKSLILPQIDITHSISLEQHQQKIKSAIEKYNQFILKAPTGAGKTEMALYCLATIRQPTLIIVPTKALLEEWVSRITRTLNINSKNIGILSGGEHYVTPITVGIKNTIYNDLPQLVDKFGMVICDEAYSFGSKTYNYIADCFPANWRIALTAWEQRKDGKEFLIYEQFSDDIIEITNKEAADAGRVLPIRVELIPSKIENDSTKYSEIVSDLSNNYFLCMFVVKLIVNLYNDGEKIIVFNERNNLLRIVHRELKRNNVNSFILIGKSNADSVEYSKVKQGIGVDTPYVVLTNRVGYAGIDLPSATVGLATSPVFKTWGQRVANDAGTAIQQAGRVRRASRGKSHGRYLYLWHQFMFPKDLNKFEKIFGEDAVSVWTDEQKAAINQTAIKWSPNLKK